MRATVDSVGLSERERESRLTCAPINCWLEVRHYKDVGCNQIFSLSLGALLPKPVKRNITGNEIISEQILSPPGRKVDLLLRKGQMGYHDRDLFPIRI